MRLLPVGDGAVMEKRYISVPVDLGGKEQCNHCADLLKEALAQIDGVESAEVNLKRNELSLVYYPQMVSQATLERKARETGVDLAQRFHVETFNVTGLDCPDCAVKVDRLIAGLNGVQVASLNFATGKLHIEYEPQVISRDEIVKNIEALGYGVSRGAAPQGVATSVFALTGLDCPECALKIERKVSLVPGVRKVTASATTQKMIVEREGSVATDAEIIRAVQDIGYDARLEQAVPVEVPAAPWWRRHPRVVLTSISGLLFVLGLVVLFLGGSAEFSSSLFVAAVVAGAYYIVRGAYFALRARTADMNLLMTIAVVGAIAIGEYTEAAAIVFLFSVANALESFSLDRTRGAIKALVALAPNEALALRNGHEVRVRLEDLAIGEIVVVRPGERIPVDGIVINGVTSVNQAPITGESTPVEKRAGDEVFAGTINGRAALEVRVDRLAKDSTLARIIHLVEEAQTQKAASQQFVDRFSAYYTPIVIVIAALVVIVPTVLGYSFATWFYRGLVLLVIACPCALVISTPVSIVSAIGVAARNGSLIKGGAYLEELGKIAAVAFDKTGTLTEGKPRVTDVLAFHGYVPREVLAVAASVEARSEHPLAGAVVDEARHQDIQLRPTKTFEAFAGRGARATFDGITYYVGNQRLFNELQVPSDDAQQELARLQEEGKSAIIIGTERKLMGIVAVADTIRASSKETVDSLHRLGIARVTMLTGDATATATAVAHQLGIDEYQSELLPEDKVNAVRDLSRRYGRVAMVGDGVNDAPALAASRIGIAMGAAGSDVALETADVALMSDDLSKVPFTIGLGRATNITIRQNIIFALAVKAIFLALTVLGFTTLWLAVVADMGASLIVVANGLRLLRYRRKS